MGLVGRPGWTLGGELDEQRAQSEVLDLDLQPGGGGRAPSRNWDGWEQVLLVDGRQRDGEAGLKSLLAGAET